MGGAGEQQVSGTEVAERGQLGESLSGPVPQIAGAVVLAELAVDLQAQLQVVQERELARLRDREIGPGRAEPAVALALEVLALRELDVAGGYVVGDGDAEDVLVEVLGGDGLRLGDLLAQHQGELDLVVEQPHVSRPGDGRVGTGDCGVRLVEEQVEGRASGSIPDSIACCR